MSPRYEPKESVVSWLRAQAQSNTFYEDIAVYIRQDLVLTNRQLVELEPYLIDAARQARNEAWYWDAVRHAAALINSVA